MFQLRSKNCLAVFLLFYIISSSAYAQNGTWTWMRGSNVNNQPGNFGVQGVASPANDPPGLYEACEWTDLQGNFWIFGGINNSFAEYSVLWKFDPTTNLWTWVNGPNTTSQSGSYGIQGVPAPGNFPGSRAWGVLTWVDQAGDLWLFGGYGYDAFGALGGLNDLWRYNIATNTWTWMRGSNAVSSLGNYGTLQVSSNTNDPPSIVEVCSSWTSNTGDLWFYGAVGIAGLLSDMWKYNIATNEWTWMSGSGTPSVPANWGTQFVASPTNTPGGRYVYSRWVDNSGNFWLYGGYDIFLGFLSDMWMYDVNTNLWTWMAGTTTYSSFGTFNTQCQLTSNHPTSRFESRVCWTDECGRFWQFGGIDPNGATLSDLWMYDPVSNQFNWIAGTLLPSQLGNYGTILVPAQANYPESAAGGNAFVDNNGDFWMFGGLTVGGRTNALWKYIRDPNCNGGGISAAFTGTPISGCVPLTVNFTPNSSNAQNNYHWDFGDPNATNDTSNVINSSYTYTLAGTYTVTLIVDGAATCGPNADTSTIVVTVNPLPVISLGNDTVVCDLINITLDAGNVGASYIWSTGAVTQTITVNAAGTYWVDANLNGCHDTDTIVVQQFLPPQIGNDTLVCEGQIVPLNGGIGQSWLWSTGAVTQNISVNTSGSYWVETTNGPCVKRDTIVVTVQQLPVVDVGPDSVLCPNSSYTLDAGNPGATYLWSTGDVTQSIVVNTAGTFSVVVTQNGCPGSDTVIIQTTSAIGLQDEASLCDVLDIELDAGNPGSTYLWNTGATTQAIVVNAAGEYYVQVNNGFCTIHDTIEVTGSPGEGALFVPNTFTPNSNDLNERFFAKGEGVVDFQMRIFDRWGNLIFETNNINEGWDGKVKDQVSQIDTYVYVINYTTLCSEGKRLQKLGHVNIIR